MGPTGNVMKWQKVKAAGVFQNTQRKGGKKNMPAFKSGTDSWSVKTSHSTLNTLN